MMGPFDTPDVTDPRGTLPSSNAEICGTGWGGSIAVGSGGEDAGESVSDDTRGQNYEGHFPS